jgi:hypothetical protein
LDEYGKLPDVVYFDESENRIFLVEAIASLHSVSPNSRRHSKEAPRIAWLGGTREDGPILLSRTDFWPDGNFMRHRDAMLLRDI